MSTEKASATISYELNEADVRKALFRNAFVSPHSARSLIVAGLAGAVAAMASGLSAQGFRWFPALLTLGTFVLAFPVVTRVLVSLQVGKLRATGGTTGIICRHTLTADGSGLRETTPVNTSTSAWSTVHSVERWKSHAIVRLKSGNFHAIPVREFSRMSELDDFLQTVERYRREQEI